MEIKLFIVLSIFLNKSFSSDLNEDEFDSNESVKLKPVIINYHDKWLVNFVRTIDNKYESCQAMPIRRRVFIADAECINRAANIDHWSITIDFYHGSMRFSNMAYVQDKNIFYNANLTSEYDPENRKIAILITDQRVLSDDNKALLMGIAQMAYQEVLSYNEDNQIKKLPNAIADKNYAKCFMSIFKSSNITIPCYGLNATFTSCMYQVTDYTIPQYDNLLNYLFCHIKSNKEKVVLVGVLSESKKPKINIHEGILSLEFENIDDFDIIIQRKLREWSEKNPYQPTYPLY
ncbi:GSCOCG00011267001-RA-CDS [Cotesia congregata]|nr:GSCOCG00011267001-RA-CDS [Cotesia congregata]